MIYLNSEKKLKELEGKMNKHNICIFIDFDKTITSYDSEDSWAASANKKIFGEKIVEDLEEYYKKYGWIEFDYKIDKQKREEYIIEWYDKCMELYYQYGLTKEKLKKSIENSKLILRKGVKDFFLKMCEENIPVIIFSAGIGNVIEQFLRDENCYYKNVYIISNFIKFNKEGKMLKFSDYMIHSLNKNIDKLEDVELKEKIQAKEYRVVIGDLIEDINMRGKYPENKSLKIGFLNKNITENLEVYNKNFDIVLTENNDFYDIEKYMLYNA